MSRKSTKNTQRPNKSEPRIRIRQKDRDEIKKINKRFENRNQYLKREYGIEIAFEKKTIKEFNTRKEYKRYVSETKKLFGSINEKPRHNYDVVINEKGVEVPFSTYETTIREVRKQNQERAKRLNILMDMDFTDRGTSLGQIKDIFNPKSGRVGDLNFSAFKPIKFNNERFRSPGEFEKWSEHVTGLKGVLERDEIYRQNYLKALDKTFGTAGVELSNYIKNMSLSQFIADSFTKNLAYIGFIYERTERDIKLKGAMQEWGLV